MAEYNAVSTLARRVQPIMAANVWDKATKIMMDVCNQIVLISTIAAVVTDRIHSTADYASNQFTAEYLRFSP